MAVNPTDVRVLRYNTAKAFRALIGATAMRPGALAKYSAGALIPAADNDENIRLYVILEQGDAAARTLVVPFSDAVLEMGYTGTPTEGLDCGISDSVTVDASNVTQLMVTIVGVNTARTTVDIIEYQVGG